jgi:hypothetical protein
LSTEPTSQELLEVQAFFNLPSPALVEKDYYVTRALAALASMNADPFRLVFGGGTSLSRAHRLIQRMSEDIDLKIVGAREPTRPELRLLRDHVTAALQFAGFDFDPANRNHRDSRNESRYTIFRLPYAPALRGEGVLRPEIQIEIAVWPLHCPSVALPIRSFVAEAYGRPAEIESLACVSVTQTAAEKFVALTRRAAAEIAGAGGPRDSTLVRHLYDLHAIRSHYDPAEAASLARTIMQQDALVFGNQFPAYRDDPISETRKALAALATNPAYARSYEDFQRYMVYGEAASFDACLAALDELAVQFG